MTDIFYHTDHLIKNIATIASEFSIQSYIHSTSIPSASRDKPYEVGSSGHAKFAIEDYISSLNIPWTCVFFHELLQTKAEVTFRIIRPGFFMENFSPGMIGRVMDGVFRHSFPAKCKIQFVVRPQCGSCPMNLDVCSPQAVDDIGRFSRAIFDVSGTASEYDISSTASR